MQEENVLKMCCTTMCKQVIMHYARKSLRQYFHDMCFCQKEEERTRLNQSMEWGWGVAQEVGLLPRARSIPHMQLPLLPSLIPLWSDTVLSAITTVPNLLGEPLWASIRVADTAWELQVCVNHTVGHNGLYLFSRFGLHPQ